MSDPDQDPGDRPTGRPTESGKRRARILIPLGILLVAIALITYMIVVSQTAGDDESQSQSQETGATPVSLHVGAARGPLAVH